MITILYDTAAERDNFTDFLRRKNCCFDFSDSLPECNGSCNACRQHFIENCIHNRTDYHSRDFLPVAGGRSCDTCANSPICWLSSTAAYPHPCVHYIPEGRSNK